MGEHISKSKFDQTERKAFVQHLLDDIKALELILDQDLIESDIVRIGAEQELCLVDEGFRPSGESIKLLEAIDDPHFTTELANYNIDEARKIMGKPSESILEILGYVDEPELVHRDNMVLV